ncbi:hypothetical protein CEXT_773881 [Caerostris extrusa]|uniref:Uncharacterized protein n=1 Tax=Caerostris extrusa TaxID=172846 RepID=A0AAV4X160_CAEEX|nr:hypothetical protein CEXT_773881 [Caerostris extrusa]
MASFIVGSDDDERGQDKQPTTSFIGINLPSRQPPLTQENDDEDDEKEDSRMFSAGGEREKERGIAGHDNP